MIIGRFEYKLFPIKTVQDLHPPKYKLLLSVL